MRIYLDIDGVILKKDLTIPDFGVEFISFLVTNHDCYWLSTHCKGGENKVLNHLSRSYPSTTQEQLRKIKATNWTDLKTEAIDLAEDFIWLEDYPFEAEKMVLKRANKIDSLITVDLKRANELRRIQEKIELLTTQKLNY